MRVEHDPTHTALGVEAERIVILPSIRFRVSDTHELRKRPATVGKRYQAGRGHVDIQGKVRRLVIVSVIHPAVP